MRTTRVSSHSFLFQTQVVNTMCGYRTIDKEVMSSKSPEGCSSCPLPRVPAGAPRVGSWLLRCPNISGCEQEPGTGRGFYPSPGTGGLRAPRAPRLGEVAGQGLPGPAGDLSVRHARVPGVPSASLPLPSEHPFADGSLSLGPRRPWRTEPSGIPPGSAS